MTQRLSDADVQDRLWKAIEDHHTGMLGLSGDNHHFQPMTAFAEREANRIWFFTNVRTVGTHQDQPNLWGNRNTGTPANWNYEKDDSVTQAAPGHLTNMLRVIASPSTSETAGRPCSARSWTLHCDTTCGGSPSSTQ